MSTIDNLEANVRRLTDELRAAKEKLTAAKIETSPIKIGQIYTRTRRQAHGVTAKAVMERAQVVRYGRTFYPEAPVALLFKADGTLGKRECSTIGDDWGGWVLEPPAAAPADGG